MAFNLSPVFKQRFFDANGNPLVGGKLYTYQAGTSVPQPTYTDSSGNTANTNPVILDANGEATVWFDVELSYKVILTDANDVEQWSQDGIIGLLTNDSVGTDSYQDESITEPKLADDAVSARVLSSDDSVDANRAVGSNHIKNESIVTRTLAPTVFSGLTEDTSPDWNSDYVPIYDSSASGNKKVLMSRIGALQHLQTQSASNSASVAFTSGIDATFDVYVFEVTNYAPGTNLSTLLVQVSDDGGGSWKTTSYRYGGNSGTSGGTGGAYGNDTSVSGYPIFLQQVNTTKGAGTIKLFTPSNTTATKKFIGHTSNVDFTNDIVSAASTGEWTGSTGAINAVRFICDSGNISTGTFSLYGVRK